MNLPGTFDITYGTTAGRRHRTTGNLASNQDANGSFATNNLIVGAVSDGCGSQTHSEFGSRLAVNILLKLIRQHHAAGRTFDEDGFDRIYKGLVRRIKSAATTLLDGPVIEAINSHMMATAGGLIITPETATFFGAGDFTFMINGVQHVWKPEDGNKPLYPALSLAFPGDPRFKFRTHTVPTADLETFLIATDGGEELIRVCNDPDEYVPGTDDPAGPLDKIWTTDSFYQNEEAFGSWLNRLAQNWRMPGPPHHGGLLDDDTTVFAGRLRNRKETVA